MVRERTDATIWSSISSRACQSPDRSPTKCRKQSSEPRMPEERSVRDRLAEALWILTASMEPGDWDRASRAIKKDYHADAARFLKIAALPSVGLQLVPLSPH